MLRKIGENLFLPAPFEPDALLASKNHSASPVSAPPAKQPQFQNEQKTQCFPSNKERPNDTQSPNGNKITKPTNTEIASFKPKNIQSQKTTANGTTAKAKTPKQIHQLNGLLPNSRSTSRNSALADAQR